ncbi:DNA integrity scanning protein DisA nucleotide-binding domain protein [Candidatus Woesearchaeota archaeon]|nr:DNA integrity scanning protein DisA nucleotide-binding domain protein [Candidatus Woesearchaeota archaeon]
MDYCAKRFNKFYLHFFISIKKSMIPSLPSNPIQESISQAVGTIARNIKANIIVTLTRKEVEIISAEESLSTDVRAVVFKRTDTGAYLDQIHETTLLKKMDSLKPIKDLLSDFVTKKIISKGDRVICVADETLGVGFSGLMFILDIDDVFFKVSTHKITENIDSDAFESLINIAFELVQEGREGKKVGTSFVVGDYNELKQFCRQLIFNPFQGYSEEKCKIQDPEIKETVKEFSQLDGAFIIERNGRIQSAGTYLDLDTSDVEIPDGFGTKHRCCAAITKKCDAIAVVLSESGVVRILKKGKIIARLN